MMTQATPEQAEVIRRKYEGFLKTRASCDMDSKERLIFSGATAAIHIIATAFHVDVTDIDEAMAEVR